MKMSIKKRDGIIRELATINYILSSCDKSSPQSTVDDIYNRIKRLSQSLDGLSEIKSEYPPEELETLKNEFLDLVNSIKSVRVETPVGSLGTLIFKLDLFAGWDYLILDNHVNYQFNLTNKKEASRFNNLEKFLFNELSDSLSEGDFFLNVIGNENGSVYGEGDDIKIFNDTVRPLHKRAIALRKYLIEFCDTYNMDTYDFIADWINEI